MIDSVIWASSFHRPPKTTSRKKPTAITSPNTECGLAITGRFLKSQATKSLSIVSSIERNPTAETTMSIHPQIIEKDGRKEFVVLPYEEFLQMQEEIENYEDLHTLREEKATAHGEPTRSLDEVLGEIGN
jgi:PHD/YefM family antitoxin component YafN of YafNO toxin-antitoxin module